MRKSCLECVAKHLGSAAVYIDEVNAGYPNYYGYVYGELDHAASECIEEVPALAMAIREHRISWAATRKDPVAHRIPFEAMFDFIDAMEIVGTKTKMDVPDEVYAGLQRDKDGRVVFTMDTRPDSYDGSDGGEAGGDANMEPGQGHGFRS